MFVMCQTWVRCLFDYFKERVVHQPPPHPPHKKNQLLKSCFPLILCIVGCFIVWFPRIKHVPNLRNHFPFPRKTAYKKCGLSGDIRCWVGEVLKNNPSVTGSIYHGNSSPIYWCGFILSEFINNSEKNSFYSNIMSSCAFTFSILLECNKFQLRIVTSYLELHELLICGKNVNTKGFFLI